jgi:hypothetical protein
MRSLSGDVVGNHIGANPAFTTSLMQELIESCTDGHDSMTITFLTISHGFMRNSKPSIRFSTAMAAWGGCWQIFN